MTMFQYLLKIKRRQKARNNKDYPCTVISNLSPLKQHYNSFPVEIVRGAFNKFPDFFVQAFKIAVDSWEFSMLLIAIHIMRWLTNFYYFRFKWTARARIRIHPTKAWLWISKMQSWRLDTFEEWYAIKLCFTLGKNAAETYGMLQTAFGTYCMNWA